MIAWRYLDKQQATIKALSDYTNMAVILEITSDELKRIQDEMTSPLGSSFDGMPRTRDVQRGEERICHAMDQRHILLERYKQAEEFMAWFTPAWQKLSEEERILLEYLFIHDTSKALALERLGDVLHIERAQLYRRKDRALLRLSILLYGS
jgi:hypothetical protein